MEFTLFFVGWFLVSLQNTNIENTCERFLTFPFLILTITLYTCIPIRITMTSLHMDVVFLVLNNVLTRMSSQLCMTTWQTFTLCTSELATMNFTLCPTFQRMLFHFSRGISFIIDALTNSATVQFSRRWYVWISAWHHVITKDAA